MKVEDLLKPRYKVLADWPESQFSSKDSPASMISYWVGRIIIYGEIGVQTQIKYDKYPHLFKKLEWWEDREESEMPEYLKSCSKPINHSDRFSNVLIKCGQDVFWNSNKFSFNKYGFVQAYGGIWIENFSPSTKEEYEQSTIE